MNASGALGYSLFIFMLVGRLSLASVTSVPVENRSLNGAIKTYALAGLSQDLVNLKPFAEALVGFNLDEAYRTLKVVITDARPGTHNGDQIFFTSIIEVQADPSSENYGEKEFKEALFHEFGHLVFQQYIQKNAVSTPIMADLEYKYVVPTSDSLAEDKVRFWSMQEILLPSTND
jgi:hypothetical protein